MNKRHYEHTLPNIRGSLSNTYLKSYPVMKEGDIVFLKRPYRGYRAVELVERLAYRWLVRVVENGLELEVYEDELTAEN